MQVVRARKKVLGAHRALPCLPPRTIPGVRMESSSFVKDTVGDVESAKYGGADRRRVPRFRRAGGACGCSGEWAVETHRGLPLVRLPQPVEFLAWMMACE